MNPIRQFNESIKKWESSADVAVAALLTYNNISRLAVKSAEESHFFQLASNQTCFETFSNE